MDWEPERDEGRRRRPEVVRRAVTIDVSDQVHLEAVVAKPKHLHNRATSSSSSSSSSSTSSALGEGEAAQQHSGDVAAPTSGGNSSSNNAKVGVVIMHPHPMLGGNMHNNVVVALFKRFAKEGFCAVRFNFRGTGRSTGSKTWRGSGEREDVLAVCRYLQSECGVEAVYLVGYSYGSAIGCSVVNDVDIIKGCIAVSYPFGVLTWILLGHLLNMAKTQKPCLWVIGTDDNFTSVSRFRQSVKGLALMGLAEEEDFTKRKKVEQSGENQYTVEYFKSRLQTTAVVHGMDHFWFDDEDILADICLAWVEARLGDQRRPAEEGEGDIDIDDEHEHYQPQRRLKDDLSEESHSKL